MGPLFEVLVKTNLNHGAGIATATLPYSHVPIARFIKQYTVGYNGTVAYNGTNFSDSLLFNFVRSVVGSVCHWGHLVVTT